MAEFTRVEGSSMLQRSRDPLHRNHCACFSVVQAASGQIYEPEDLSPGYASLRLQGEPDCQEITRLLTLQCRAVGLRMALQASKYGARTAADVEQDAATCELPAGPARCSQRDSKSRGLADPLPPALGSQP